MRNIQDYSNDELRAEVEHLRAALKAIANQVIWSEIVEGIRFDVTHGEAVDIARAALEVSGEK